MCRTDGPIITYFSTTMSSFRTLEKAILSQEQLASFQSSKTYAKITSYIETLNNAVVGFKLTDECAQSQVRQLLFGLGLRRVAAHRSEVARLLGNSGADRGAGSHRGAGEGDAAGGQRGIEVWEPCVQDVLRQSATGV